MEDDMNKILMNRSELERLLKILDRFEVNNFTLIGDNYNNGIGSTLDVEFSNKVDEYTVISKISVTSVEHW